MMRTVFLPLAVAALLVIPITGFIGSDAVAGEWVLIAEDEEDYGDLEYRAQWNGTSAAEGELSFFGFAPHAFGTLTVKDSAGAKRVEVENFNPEEDFAVDSDLEPGTFDVRFTTGSRSYDWKLVVAAYSELTLMEQGGHIYRGEDGPRTIYVPKDDSVVLPTPSHPVTGTTTISDHHFDWWSLTTDGESVVLDEEGKYTPEGNTILYAIWDETTTDYTVKYSSTYIL